MISIRQPFVKELSGGSAPLAPLRPSFQRRSVACISPGPSPRSQIRLEVGSAAVPQYSLASPTRRPSIGPSVSRSRGATSQLPTRRSIVNNALERPYVHCLVSRVSWVSCEERPSLERTSRTRPTSSGAAGRGREVAAGPATTPTRPHKAIIPFIPVSTRAHTLSSQTLLISLSEPWDPGDGPIAETPTVNRPETPITNSPCVIRMMPRGYMAHGDAQDGSHR